MYLGCLIAVIALANGLPGAGAIIGLASALPMVLAFSPLGKEPVFGPWIFMLVPLAFALWRIAGDDRPLDHIPLLAVGLVAGGLFWGVGRGRPAALALGLLAVEVWLVAYLSSGHGSGGAMLRWLVAHGIADGPANTVVFAFRKTVHLTFYGTVGGTALAAVRRVGAQRPEAVRTALLAALVVASFDELRQSGFANRTGSAWDVLLDLTGATLAVGLLEWRRHKMR